MPGCTREGLRRYWSHRVVGNIHLHAEILQRTALGADALFQYLALIFLLRHHCAEEIPHMR
jgi:hypothetical protein